MNNHYKIKCNVSFKNAKFQPSETEKYLIFNLPSEDGLQEKRFPNVMASRAKNLDQIKRNKFVNDMIETINHFLEKWGNATIHVIFTNGFNNNEFIEKWVKIEDYFKGNERVSFSNNHTS